VGCYQKPFLRGVRITDTRSEEVQETNKKTGQGGKKANKKAKLI